MAQDSSNETTVTDTIQSILSIYVENTSVHGVPRTVTRCRARRLMWLVFILTSFGWCLFQLVGTLQNYFAYPVTSVISFQHLPSTPFPAVTICNLNRLRKSKLSEETVRDIEENYVTTEGMFPVHVTENSFLEVVPLLDRRHAWHSIHDMLTFCSFNQEQCYADNFTQVPDTVNGNCYTFNREGDTETWYTIQAGPVNGLVMMLDIELSEYLPLTSAAGVKVIIHDHDEPPFPEDGGIVVQPGVVTHIGIEKTLIHRLSSPYGDCNNNSKNNARNLYQAWNYTYTENSCKKSCFQMFLYEICNCCDLQLPCNTPDILKMAGKERNRNMFIPYCDYKNADIVDCVDKVHQLIKTYPQKCADFCPPACDVSVYRNVVSSALWPTQLYLDMFVNKSAHSQQNSSSRTTLQDFRERYLKVSIYYSHLEITEITTKPEYSHFKVFGDIGGQLGLMIGASILSAVEVVELLFDISYVYITSFYSWFFTRKLNFSK